MSISKSGDFFLLFPRLLCSILFIGVPPARVRLNHMPGAEGRLLHSNGPKASFWASRDTRSGIPLPGAQMFCFLGQLCFLRIFELLRKCLFEIPWVNGGSSSPPPWPPNLGISTDPQMQRPGGTGGAESDAWARSPLVEAQEISAIPWISTCHW